MGAHILADGQVGERTVQDGTENALRTARTGELIASDGKGRYSELAERGRLFVSATGAAGVAPGTALATTPPLSIWNPPSSQVALHMIRARIGYLSGTIGSGSMVLAQLGIPQTSTPSGGTPITPRNTRTGLSGTAQGFQGSTIAAVPSILFPLLSLTAFTAATAMVPIVPGDIDLGGEVVVPPGGVVALQGIAAAGTTPLVLLGLMWAELPL